MRALFAGGNGPPHFREVSTPTLQSDFDALVRPVAVALCDLDVPLIANRLPSTEPFALGHEFTAEVVAVGDQVEVFKPGDLVTLPFQISCGACTRCRSRRSLDCTAVPPLATYGLTPFGGGHWGGAVADLVRVPFAQAMMLHLPANSDPVSLASVSDNVADGYRCVVPHVQAGDELLIIGSASVGLYAAAVAGALGVACTYVDDDRSRLEVAQKFGARLIEATPDGTKFGEFPVTAACNSTAGGLRSALASTEPGGICQSAGIHFQSVELPLLQMYRRGVRLHIGRANARNDMPAILALVGSGKLKPELVTAQVVPVDLAIEALSAPLPHKTVLTLTS
jgi:threonine dehydrogenase-like Zn-dependent dehydrogenase